MIKIRNKNSLILLFLVYFLQISELRENGKRFITWLEEAEDEEEEDEDDEEEA